MDVTDERSSGSCGERFLELLIVLMDPMELPRIMPEQLKGHSSVGLLCQSKEISDLRSF